MASIDELKIKDSEVQSYGIQGIDGDRMDLPVQEAKKRFDRLPTLIRDRLNATIDYFYSLINVKDQSVRTDFQNANTILSNRVTVLEHNKESAPVDEHSTVEIDVNVSTGNVVGGNVELGEVLGLLGANSNDTIGKLSNIEGFMGSVMRYDTIHDLRDSSEPLYGVGFNSIRTGGMYRTNPTFGGTYPSVFRDTKPSLHLEVISDGEQFCRQTIHVYEPITVYDSVISPCTFTRSYDFQSSRWGTWYAGCLNENVINEVGEENSFFRLGDILVCMGYVSTGNTVANTTKSITVNFPRTYDFAPYTFAGLGGSPQVATVIVSTADITTLGMNVNIYQNSTTSRAIRWFAIGKSTGAQVSDITTISGGYQIATDQARS